MEEWAAQMSEMPQSKEHAPDTKFTVLCWSTGEPNFCQVSGTIITGDQIPPSRAALDKATSPLIVGWIKSKQHFLSQRVPKEGCLPCPEDD